MPDEVQAFYSRKYKTDKQFVREVDEFEKSGFGLEEAIQAKNAMLERSLPQMSVPYYCETVLKNLLGPEQTETWLSFKRESQDTELRNAKDQTFLANLRAAHIELLGIAINKTYRNPHLNCASALRRITGS
jgi:hypothetical protein